MTPLERYQQALDTGGFTFDPNQQRVMTHFQRLFDDICTRPKPSPAPKSKPRWLEPFRKRKTVAPATTKGLYIWGGVGRGKTHLFDLFYEVIPFEQKLRIHFHRFMREVHQQLKQLGQVPDPLERVAEHFSQKARVICLDEMHINDITDAMLMYGLLRGLFERGVALVTTSNVPPDGLYKDGLQRARFIPAIELMKQHTHVINMDGDTDYRLRKLEQAEIYHHPLDDQAETSLAASFNSLIAGDTPHSGFININGRDIPVRYWADDVVWFEFEALCNTPRSNDDYIEIATLFHTVLIGSVPTLDEKSSDQARRWINMIDEFYDRNVKVIISAESPPIGLYQGTRLSFEFERTVSRLLEMQSHEYLAKEHKTG